MENLPAILKPKPAQEAIYVDSDEDEKPEIFLKSLAEVDHLVGSDVVYMELETKDCVYIYHQP